MTSIVIPASVTSIGNNAFGETMSLKTVTFAGTSQLTTIGEGAFTRSALASITIPASVTSIQPYAFSEATSLTTVTFAGTSQLTTIGDSVFENTSIMAITIPASVSSIGSNIFYDARWLTRITFLGSINGGSSENGSIFLPNLEREGHTFSGWYSDSNFTTKIGDGGLFFNVSQPTSLFANLTKKAEATTKPTVTGTSKVSKTLTANKGVWTGFPDPTFSYQWYLCTAQVSGATATIPRTCTVIAKATKTTFALTSAHKNKYLAVAVTGTSAGTSATRWLSKSTAKVS
jgi:uncharacterized repeat protein (TIGR02543 family)